METPQFSTWGKGNVNFRVFSLKLGFVLIQYIHFAYVVLPHALHGTCVEFRGEPVCVNWFSSSTMWALRVERFQA